MKQKKKTILEAVTSNGFSTEEHEVTYCSGCLIVYAFKNSFACDFMLNAHQCEY